MVAKPTPVTLPMPPVPEVHVVANQTPITLLMPPVQTILMQKYIIMCMKRHLLTFAPLITMHDSKLHICATRTEVWTSLGIQPQIGSQCLHYVLCMPSL